MNIRRNNVQNSVNFPTCVLILLSRTTKLFVIEGISSNITSLDYLFTCKTCLYTLIYSLTLTTTQSKPVPFILIQISFV